MNAILVTLVNNYVQYIGILFLLAIAGVIVGVTGHYLIFGPHGKEFAKLKPEVLRMNLFERVIHFCRMTSCVLLAITGLTFAIFKADLLGVNYQVGLKIHIILGIIFAISSLITIVIYFKESLFKKYDAEWFKYMGGYLSKKEMHLPAGKFNAGQKSFFWFSALFSIVIVISGYLLMNPNSFNLNIMISGALIHGLSALLLFAGVLTHAYLGSLANPGTIQVLAHGKVAKDWAKAHHPEWAKELKLSMDIHHDNKNVHM